MAKFNKLAGKHVLVIGGSKGIGLGVVEASLDAGARVTLSGSAAKSTDAALAQVKASYPTGPVIGIPCDLSKDSVEQDLEALFTQAKAAQGQDIDHVVVTAGDPLVVMPVPEITLEKIRRAARLRFEVPVLIGKVAFKHLRKTRDCSLTITTGGIADQPAPGWSVVAFTGAGLTGLARGLALDMKPIRVNAVEPGAVDTPLWTSMGLSEEQKAAEMKKWGEKLPTGQVGQVEDVAEAYVYLMKDGNCTGEILKTRGGAHLI
ncbi:NAD(P)-binding protein [Hypomontagnella submonticulosa]|nr:NAD(P)-binding protein [Hypomontagnella submonticulosa]